MTKTIISMVFVIVALSSTLCATEKIKIAVASNFYTTMKKIALKFETIYPYKIILISGATGQQYAQIVHGAPYDLFFAADSKRPELLEESGTGVDGSRFTYAIGALVLWSSESDLIDANATILKRLNFSRLAIANPKVAPYAQASLQTLKALNIFTSASSKIVYAQSVAQALMFAQTQNAQLAFISYAQLKSLNQGSYYIVPQTLYDPIIQQAIVLKKSRATEQFLRFFRSREVGQIIKHSGYTLP